MSKKKLKQVNRFLDIYTVSTVGQTDDLNNFQKYNFNKAINNLSDYINTVSWITLILNLKELIKIIKKILSILKPQK